MEIERKFWMTGFPKGLSLLRESVMYQGYICTDPVVRIRSTQTAGSTEYILCLKGKGTLAREEIETPISAEVFEKLCDFIGTPLVRKDFKAYALPDGHVLECSLVDQGSADAFYYAEVEFSSVEEAIAFQPPAFLGRELTEDPSFTMSGYWKKKVKGAKGAPSR